MAQAAKITKSFGGDALDALGNPVRRAIVAMLAERPRAVGELAAALPISRPAVSKHLRVLKAAQLVSAEPAGNRNVYALSAGGVTDVRRWLDKFWGEALPRFAMVAENTFDEGAS
ncbi:MAG: metalloregulator ArsR/SmtB family transcription factor [Myxococcota bacterium]